MLPLIEKLPKVNHLPSRKALRVLVTGLVLFTGLLSYRPDTAFAAAREAGWPGQPPAAPPALPVTEDVFFNDDLTISAEEVYHGDVVVYSGDVTIERGGAIHGDLVLFSGDLALEAGSEVHGDIVVISGDVAVDGYVSGDLAVLSGDITLGETAVVSGDISLMDEIARSPGATVAGSIVAGPKFPEIAPLLNKLNLPVVPNAIEGIAPTAPPAPDPNAWQTGALLRVIWRLLGGAVLTGLIVLTSSLVYYARPTFVQEVRGTLNGQRPLSFGIGLAINLVLTLLMGAAFGTGSLLVTICLSPLGLMAGLLFFAINLGGWAALSLEVGERLLARLQMESRKLLQLLAGAIVLTAPLTLAWAIGSCFQPVGYLAMLALTALGGGAVVVNRLKLGRGGTGLTPSSAISAP